MRTRTPAQELASFHAGYVINSDTGCWEWTRAIRSTDGYAKFSAASRTVKAHRFAYERLVGPIPDGLVIDHLCRVRHCVNPSHLEPVTQRENMRRGVAPAAALARQTHCKRGHPFDESNTYVRATCRECKTCKRDEDRRRRAVGRAA